MVNDIGMFDSHLIFATDAKSLWYIANGKNDPEVYTQFWNWYNPEKGKKLSDHDQVLALDETWNNSRFFSIIKPEAKGSESLLFYSINVIPWTDIQKSRHFVPWTPEYPATIINDNKNLSLIIGLSVGVPLE